MIGDGHPEDRGPTKVLESPETQVLILRSRCPEVTLGEVGGSPRLPFLLVAGPGPKTRGSETSSRPFFKSTFDSPPSACSRLRPGSVQRYKTSLLVHGREPEWTSVCVLVLIRRLVERPFLESLSFDHALAHARSAHVGPLFRTGPHKRHRHPTYGRGGYASINI